MDNGFFRKKNGYTVVQNGITRDIGISLKAKGLYLVIQSYITMPEKKWSKEDFFNMTCEGIKAFESAWNELKQKGYLRVHIYSTGHTWKVEYELLDEASEDGTHTYYYNKNGELTRTNLDNLEDRKSVVKDENTRTPQNGGNGSEPERNSRTPHFGIYGNGIYGNGGNNNNTYNINTKCNNNLSINQSINQSGDADEQNGLTESDDVIERIRENIELDIFSSRKKEEAVELFGVMSETVKAGSDTVKIAGVSYPYKLVVAKFLLLRADHIEYVIEAMRKKKGRIYNIRAYMLTALYNAPDTINHYYQAEVNADFGGG